jgi:hypothetical protein
MKLLVFYPRLTADYMVQLMEGAAGPPQNSHGSGTDSSGSARWVLTANTSMPGCHKSEDIGDLRVENFSCC